MRKLPPQIMAFPESPDVFQFSLWFEGGGGICAVVSVLCRIGQDCVRIY